MTTTLALDDTLGLGIIELDSAELTRVNGGETPWWATLLLKAAGEVIENWGAFKEGFAGGYDSVANNPG